MVAELRAANIRAELYLVQEVQSDNEICRQAQRACVVIQGSDEKNDASGEQVVVKDLVLGAQLSKMEKAARNTCRSRPTRSARCARPAGEDRAGDFGAAWGADANGLVLGRPAQAGPIRRERRTWLSRFGQLWATVVMGPACAGTTRFSQAQQFVLFRHQRDMLDPPVHIDRMADHLLGHVERIGDAAKRHQLAVAERRNARHGSRSSGRCRAGGADLP